jgi:hypothetical protein
LRTGKRDSDQFDESIAGIPSRKRNRPLKSGTCPNPSRAIRTYRDRLPKGFFPVADDGAGNQICWGPGIDGTPVFHWWDHENEWDIDDYEEDTGEAMPPEAKYQNLYFISTSLEGMMQMMEASS